MEGDDQLKEQKSRTCKENKFINAFVSARKLEFDRETLREGQERKNRKRKKDERIR